MRLGRLAAFIGVFILVSCSDSSNDPSPAPDGDPSCEGGLVLCEGSCVDLSSDVLHCGQCGRACSEGESCIEGVCEGGCDDGLQLCEEGCVDVGSDTENCGGCGIACGDSQTCSHGECADLCPEGDGLFCNGECIDPQTDSAHCGSCDNACAAHLTCVEGSCACPGGGEDCDGTCIDLDSDPLNCGACNRSCLGGANSEGGVCESGACVLSCEDGWADCDGDPTNGCEAKLDEDTENCGGCGNACEAGSQVDAVLCIEGTCEIAQCTQGWDDCDFAYDTGCEADLSSDTLHCGLCDNTCAGLPNNEASACSDGECVIDCASGWGNCDEIVANGCETNLLIDAQHCGDCDNPCDTSATRASAKRSCSSAVEESILVCSGKADRCIAGGTFRRGSISLPAS